jgi:hypothetical protein
MSISESIELVLSRYVSARSEAFGSEHELWQVFKDVCEKLEAHIKDRPTLKVKWGVGKGNWARVPWIAFVDERTKATIQRGVYCVFLFREDASGVYLTFNQGVTDPIREYRRRKAHELLRAKALELRTFCRDLPSKGFLLDEHIDLRTTGGIGKDYEYSTAAYKLYERGSVPDDSALLEDLTSVLEAYDLYVAERGQPATPPEEDLPTSYQNLKFDLASATESLIEDINASGLFFEPWQIATYVTALRTKPFLILAGVTGTGKSKLPAVVAKATGALSNLVPVRPDWTDSADVLGYVDLQGSFRPGIVLKTAADASKDLDRLYVCIMDEMNLARVEQYFAEILSQIENRGLKSETANEPLITQSLGEADEKWSRVGLSPNLAFVGTVNMDETTHGFSRKVLDRAFTLELSDVQLSVWKAENSGLELEPKTWPIAAWYPRARALSGLRDTSIQDGERVEQVIKILIEINSLLTPAQLQIGYRTRDEIALFVLHAQEVSESFVSTSGDAVVPLDLAVQMKILPRIVGGSGAVRFALMGLLGWAFNSQSVYAEDDVNRIVKGWADEGRPGAYSNAQFPRTAARLCLMWERLLAEGYTSFWL